MPLSLALILIVAALVAGVVFNDQLTRWSARQEGGSRKQLAQAKATLNKLGVHID